VGPGDPVVRDRDGRGREGVSWKRKSSSQFSVGVAVKVQWVEERMVGQRSHTETT